MTILEEAFAGKPLSCRVIDAHSHLGPSHLNNRHQKYDRVGTAEAIEDFARLGIDCIVTSPHSLSQGRMEESNELTAAAVRQFPGRVYGYITIVPWCGMEATKKAVRLYGSDPQFLGFKFLTGYHGELMQPEYEYAMDFADERKGIVLCHEWGDSPKRSGFEQALKTRHEMKLIIAHQGGGSAEDTRACAPIIQNHDNAYMDLCGSLENQLPVEQITELAGEDKVIFGTDQIDLDAKYEIGRVAFSPLDDAVKKKIFAENFLRLLETSQMGKITI